MRIDALHRHPHLIPDIARQLHEAWRDFPPWASLSDIEQRLAQGAQLGRAPFTLVAMGVDDDFLGTASVKLFELPEHTDKVHWLGEVFVPTAARGRGIGTALTRACLEESRQLGLPALYLYTPDQQALYARLGWKEVEGADVNGETVSIMCLDL